MKLNFSEKFIRIHTGIVLLFIFHFFASDLSAIDKITEPSLQDTTVTLSAPVELHISATQNAMVNSTVSLNNEDAWLFFDNIKPSDVISNYMQYVKVNGNSFTNGGNGRVAIYGNGAVLIPLGSTFKPLTVYTDEDFQGDSMKYSIQTFYTDLGTFDRTIESIRLKRGYMATFATNRDGTGYSRVFIADNEDLDISIMQPEFQNSISFIRVFRHEWVSKKGKAGWNPNDINATSYYDWNINGSSSADVEYALIRQNAGWPSWSEINAKPNVSHLLGFNEPDQSDQANMTFQQMIDLWPGMMQSGLRIGSPAWANPWNGSGGGTLFDFINKCDELNYRVDFVAVHCYWGGKSPINWYNDLKYIYETTGRPLWITEWNNGANWTTEWWPDADRTYTDANAQKQLNDIKGILQVLDTASFVERYFIYDWVQDCRAMVLGGNLTLAGEYYTANKSQIAYNKNNDVIVPPWNYDVPVLSYQYLSLSNKIALRWTDPNGGLSRGIRIEKKVNNGDYGIIHETEDISATSYADDLDSTISGRISYRMSIKTMYGDYVASNEVSYYQSKGSQSLQLGNFPYNNKDWNTTLFSEKFPEKPMVITGIPTFSNIVAMTHRVNAVSNTSFKFQLDTWNYLNDPTLTKTDNISIMALPAGNYTFGRLQGEVGNVSNIAADWIPVTFNQPFDSIPVVFCSQVTNNTFFPTMPAIRNVTRDGFEVSLRCEEKISSSSILPEVINFMAIECGKGAIGEYRITVSQTAEGEKGISGDPVTIGYNPDYSSPGLFASMLTSSDNFSSTLRYYSSGDTEFTILKQRENSGQITAIKEDKLGWMIIDLAQGQIINTVTRPYLPEKPVFYPNPVERTLYFEFSKPTRVEIYDILGRIQLQELVSNSMDISVLTDGTYILKAEGYVATIIIKQTK